ncbi:MAG: hypothetical protein JNN30_09805 [Rhodanobacteraceae bacterium]|nr:hypothetical protein [Rhodanobacteraceae bacterium]
MARFYFERDRLRYLVTRGPRDVVALRAGSRRRLALQRQRLRLAGHRRAAP